MVEIDRVNGALTTVINPCNCSTRGQETFVRDFLDVRRKIGEIHLELDLLLKVIIPKTKAHNSIHTGIKRVAVDYKTYGFFRSSFIIKPVRSSKPLTLCSADFNPYDVSTCVK